MSDETRTTLTRTPTLDVHYCEHPECKRWAGFGFARTKSDRIRWSCWEHFPYKNAEDLAAGLEAQKAPAI